jgi:hypothetical protein
MSRLPYLSWLALVDCANEKVVIQHGSSVEVRDNFFIEGVWNGNFDEGNFDSTDCVFGTGGILRGNSVRFVSSASTTDYLYYQQADGSVVVSNSLPLLLASQGDALDPRCAQYSRINDSIMAGIREYMREIPTRRGTVTRLLYRNLEVSARSVNETDKAMPPSFACYNDYYSYLVSNYKLLVDNIRDPSRKVPMHIFSTQSTGYDSTAVNAIAAQFGIDKVFTRTKGKSPKHFAPRDHNTQVDDDGTAICQALGLNDVVPIDRRAFAREFAQEYLYYAALHSNQDANFHEIMRYVSGVSVLLTGTLGEMWYTAQCSKDRPGYINADLKRWDLGGHGLSEIRLVVGFIQLPFVYIGARRREDIVRITGYDRPIPRRIAEEAGVPRDLFGQVKVGSVVIFPPPPLPYGRQLRKEFAASLVNERIMPRWAPKLWPFVHVVNTVIAFSSPNRYRAVYYVQRLLSKLIGREFAFTSLWKHLDGSLFCFCVNKCAREYASCLKRMNA